MRSRTTDENPRCKNAGGTSCERCVERSADGKHADGRSLCRSCARHSQATCSSPLTDYSAIQRDILWILADEGASKGVSISDSLGSYYRSEVTASRVYSNLNKLVGKDIVTKRSSGRDNEYELTTAGRHALNRRRDWLESRVDGQ
ncbi:helix-turn-helix transcriptional regulator [Halobacterium salinarum]|uniref:helix-turn-helix transcriptional regulator n=1 Tax=Halobacterium salinarum TaxID=2242 RepID=UPI00399D43EF|nr:PadR family transcriptional regulator [Halobacterium salinarum]